MKIRRARRSDIDYFIELYREAYKGYEEYAYTTTRDIRDYFKWLHGRDREGIFVAVIDDVPVGFAACDSGWFSRMERKIVAELHELFVREDLRGKGVASKLLIRAENYGREKGRDEMGLWVGEKNEPAKRFYLKHGFRESGKLGRWIRMVKRI
ncbi:GNAT family N-acetyltransferase [Geoglobus acetivorans]|uniref:GNAT family N-acetyltransferase n=1 Tax=Geoglobus acetivorans TaxID=565033 RepID=A0ABZ3H5N2_GEOAI|nr:GNAT family N-acetyltransferase [Geoglobus acetivorans]